MPSYLQSGLRALHHLSPHDVQIWTQLLHRTTRKHLIQSSHWHSPLSQMNKRRASQQAVQRCHSQESGEYPRIQKSDGMKWYAQYSPDEHLKHVSKIEDILGFKFENHQYLWGILQWQENKGDLDPHSRLSYAWEGDAALKLALIDKNSRDGNRGKNDESDFFMIQPQDGRLTES